MAALRFKPGPFRSETRLCPLVSLLKSPPAILQAVASPTCPSGGGTLPGAGCPWSPIRVAHLSPLLLPSSFTSHVLSCHCGPQDDRLFGKESAMQEPRVRSLGREDPLEKEMATSSSILAWKIPWTEEPGGLLDTN